MYCGLMPNSDEELERIYGKQIFDKYGWVEPSMISLVAMEFGAVMPLQVAENIGQGYRSYGISGIEWW